MGGVGGQGRGATKGVAGSQRGLYVPKRVAGMGGSISKRDSINQGV